MGSLDPVDLENKYVKVAMEIATASNTLQQLQSLVIALQQHHLCSLWNRTK